MRLQYCAVTFFVAIASRTIASDVQSDHSYAWQENTGWTNWRDAGDGLEGVCRAPTYLSGFVWGENIGWINLGDGAPLDGISYGNTVGEDAGVNIDASGYISGLAWGENVGWINFDVSTSDAEPPHLDLCTRQLSGYAWGENIGWLNLNDGEHYVAFNYDADCNGNGREDSCDIAECDADPACGDCDADDVPDGCQYDVVDCDGNGISDACEIAQGLATDCQLNGVLDSCELLINAVLLAEGFDAGLPAGWSATGLWGTTSSCPPPGGPCGTAPWMYFGDDATCTFDTGAPISGDLAAISIIVPENANRASLSYCSAYEGDRGEPPLGFDSAWLDINNGAQVDPVSNTTAPGGAWETRIVDLSVYRGQSVELVWHFDSIDEFSNDEFGWLIDNVEVQAELDNDCNDNGLFDACESNVVGDFNGDGMVTLADYAGLVDCLGGPEGEPTPMRAGCAGVCLSAFDLDFDDDVDLQDVAGFMRLLAMP